MTNADREQENARQAAVALQAVPEARKHDPMVVAMFERLPPPGGDWPRTERLKWMRALSHVFDLVYLGEGALKIE